MVGKNIWIIANWKSNKSIAEALDWVSKVGPQILKVDNLKVVVCPTFSAISEVRKAISAGGFSLKVGSQDLSPFGIGAYTGEEPAALLSQFVELSILGHSERRKNFEEDDEQISQKVTQAVENNITPLVCVQEEQTPVPPNCRLVTYEPVFAIGTGNPDMPENVDRIAASLKRINGRKIEVCYGGSVDSTNVKQFIVKEHISGVLVGSASLDAEEFIKIVKECVGETN